jgi:DNA-binding transcriptional LysR family regulator
MPESTKTDSVGNPYVARMAPGAWPELRDLRAFVAVWESRHLSRAAGDLHVAQPALSRQIRGLESTLEAPLLRRHARGVTPTHAGDVLHQHASALLRRLAAAVARAHALADGTAGTVVLAAGTVAVLRGLPAELQRAVREEFPDIELHLRDADSSCTAAAIRSGSIDLCLTSLRTEDPDLLVVPLWEEIVDHALLPPTHRLAGRSDVSVAELEDLPLLIPSRLAQCAAAHRVIAELRRLGLRSRVEPIDGGSENAQLWIAAGRGWCFASRTLRIAPALGNALVPVRGLAVPVPVNIVSRRADPRPAVTRVRDILVALLRGAAPKAHPVPAVTSRTRTFIGDLEVRHLQALMAVAGTGSVGQAAGRLGLSQPTVSRQLTQLERSVGVPLLERQARGMTLTAAGHSFAAAVPAIIGDLGRLATAVRRVGKGGSARCVVGMVPNPMATARLEQLVHGLRAEQSDVTVQIEEMSTPRQLEALRAHEIDLGIGHILPGATEADGITRQRILDDRIVGALVRPDHPAARGGPEAITALRDVPFLFVRREFDPRFYDRVMRALAVIGLPPRVDFTHDGLRAAWALAAQGRGWCLGVWTQLRQPPVGLVCVPLPGLSLPWGIELRTRGDELSPAVRTVERLLVAAPERVGSEVAVERGTGGRRRAARGA